jgi:DNA-binding CsgD family transcriptional regulator
MQVSDVGLVLMDLSLRWMAFDRGAAAILKCGDDAGTTLEPAAYIPEELLNILRSRNMDDLWSMTKPFRIGKDDYRCRAYLLEPQKPLFTETIVAVHIERSLSGNDPIYHITGKYHLTAREEEVLRGISIGLGTKDLANRLNISPNTVKAFLRLIMVKTGANTRAELFAKILESRSSMENSNGAAAGAGGRGFRRPSSEPAA